MRDKTGGPNEEYKHRCRETITGREQATQESER